MAQMQQIAPYASDLRFTRLPRAQLAQGPHPMGESYYEVSGRLKHAQRLVERLSAEV
jgi:hypothetical protein